jgi:hypothetical protein
MSAPLWYFAYGSNLSRAIFVDRRGMRPTAARPAMLQGHRLCFDIPIGSGERAVANLAADADAFVWGVAYAITADEFDRLDRTEGVHLNVYRRLEVDLSGVDEMPVAAFTYRSAISVPGRKPSARYMNLLLTGAREHNLPVDYIRYLQGIELGGDEREEVTSSR